MHIKPFYLTETCPRATTHASCRGLRMFEVAIFLYWLENGGWRGELTPVEVYHLTVLLFIPADCFIVNIIDRVVFRITVIISARCLLSLLQLLTALHWCGGGETELPPNFLICPSWSSANVHIIRRCWYINNMNSLQWYCLLTAHRLSCIHYVPVNLTPSFLTS